MRAVIIEDNESLRLVLRTMMEFDCAATIVGEAVDGQDGLAMIQSTNPDVAVVALHLDGMTGLQVIEAARASHPNLRLVAYSADPRLLQSAAASGADLALDKSHGPDEVCRSINTMFAARRDTSTG